MLCGPKLGLACQKQLRRKREREWAVGGIHFIDPEDGEFWGPSKTQERNWEVQWKRLCLARWRQESVLGSYGKV